ncbi:MAG: hypothetical protein J0I41_17175 [Filimonas sp.]|nr:hypothetical protein [Filimonas sp.]
MKRAPKRYEAPSAIYQEVVQALALNYNGYEVHKIIDTFIRDTIFRGSVNRRSDVWKRLFKVYDFSVLPVNDTKLFSTLCEFSSRKEYEELWDYALEGIEDKKTYKLTEVPQKWILNKKNIRIGKQLVKKLQHVFKPHRAQLAAAITATLNNIDATEKQIAVTPEKYLSFCSVMWLENLLTQYFNKRNIPTYDLQHGATRVYRKNPVDEIEYSNIVSDYHFTWGDYSRDELIGFGIEPARLISGGYPHRHTINPIRKPVGKKVIVFLSRFDFEQENYEVLAILAALNKAYNGAFSFSFKLHPSLNAKKYGEVMETQYPDANFTLLNSRITLHELFTKEQADLCIAVNTSCYFECYMLGMPTFRYFSETFDLEHPVREDLFDSTEKLQLLLDRLYNEFGRYYLQEDIYRELDYALGLSKNEYPAVLNA